MLEPNPLLRRFGTDTACLFCPGFAVVAVPPGIPQSALPHERVFPLSLLFSSLLPEIRGGLPHDGVSPSRGYQSIDSFQPRSETGGKKSFPNTDEIPLGATIHPLLTPLGQTYAWCKYGTKEQRGQATCPRPQEQDVSGRDALWTPARGRRSFSLR